MSDYFVTLQTIVHQAPLSMGFSRREYWNELPFPPPGDFRIPRNELRYPALQADALPPEPPTKSMNTGVGGLSLFQRIFHIAGEFFTSWATRDAQLFFSSRLKMFSLWLAIVIIFYFLSDLIVKTDKNLLLLWLCNYYLF